MSAPLNVDMNAVTRLTKAGRLSEAMALLQRVLSGTVQDAPAGRNNSAHRGSGSDEPPMINVTPTNMPRTQPGMALKTPEFMRAFPALSGNPEAWSTGLPVGIDNAHDSLPAGARFDLCSVRNAAGTMGYKLYVPSRYTGKPLPLVVMLHGCTQTPDDFAVGTRMNDVAEEVSCFVAYPEQTAAANTSKCWNWFRPGDQRRDRGEPSLIADVTRQIMRDYAINPARVFVAGLSAGGAAAAIMGHEYPDLYKGICVHSGLACGSAKDVPSAFAAMRTGGLKKARGQSLSKSPVPTIVFHGSADKTVNPSNADDVVEQSKSDAATAAVANRGRSTGGVEFTRIVQTDAAGNAILEQWILHGAGHAWSGGSKKGSYTDPRGPDASREMMRFFAEATKA